MNIHGPSLAIGSGIAVGAMLVALIAFDGSNDELNLITVDDPTSDISIATFMENGSPRLGNADAPVTLVEFGDYQCFFCNKFYHDTKKSLITDFVDTGKISIIFKDFTIIGPDSVGAAIGAKCATEQGMFWEYHNVLYENWNGENNGWISNDNVLRFASEIDLDTEQFAECLKSGRHIESLENSNNDAKALGISGTPAFFIIGSQGEIIPLQGAQPYEVFAKAINELSTNRQ